MLDGAGFSPDSHDGRDLLQILETYPRDELFQTPVDELRSIVTSVLYLQERRQLRLFLRQDEYGRYFSALVYLPRDRYTTAVRLRLIDILKEELGGAQRRLHRVEHRVGALPAALRVRVAPGGRAAGARPTPTSSASRPARRGHPLLGRRLRRGADRASAARSAPPSCSAATASAFPEGYKADFTAAGRRSPTSQHLEALAGAGRLHASACTSRSAPRPSERRFKIYRTGAPVSLSARAAGAAAARRRGRRRAARTSCAAPTASSGLDLRLRAAAADAGGSATSATTPASASRRPSPPSGPAAAENDGFNALVLRRRADLAPGRWCCAPTPSTCARPAPPSARTTSRTPCRTNVAHHPAAGQPVRGPALDPDRQRAGTRADRRHRWRSSTAPLDQVASLDEDRILRSFLSADQGDPAHQLLPARAPTAQPHALRVVEVRPAGHPRPARAPPGVRDLGLLARGSRACTCASARSPAAGCAGPTGARTSAPRSSAWSRRRW